MNSKRKTVGKKNLQLRVRLHLPPLWTQSRNSCVPCALWSSWWRLFGPAFLRWPSGPHRTSPIYRERRAGWKRQGNCVVCARRRPKDRRNGISSDIVSPRLQAWKKKQKIISPYHNETPSINSEFTTNLLITGKSINQSITLKRSNQSINQLVGFVWYEQINQAIKQEHATWSSVSFILVKIVLQSRVGIRHTSFSRNEIVAKFLKNL